MEEFNVIDGIGRLGLMFVPFLFALCFHEWAHGWVALKRGDPTAMMMGRLTLNPLAHVDWVGTVLIPLVSIFSGVSFIGWARPVPVNSRNLKNPVKDMFWISLAGPLSNFFLAVVGVLIWAFLRTHMIHTAMGKSIVQILDFFILINLILGIFNLIPLHPLDGAKVIARFLPDKWNRFLEEHQYQLNIFLIIFVLFGGFHFMARPILYAHSALKVVSIYVIHGLGLSGPIG